MCEIIDRQLYTLDVDRHTKFTQYTYSQEAY